MPEKCAATSSLVEYQQTDTIPRTVTQSKDDTSYKLKSLSFDVINTNLIPTTTFQLMISFRAYNLLFPFFLFIIYFKGKNSNTS